MVFFFLLRCLAASTPRIITPETNIVAVNGVNNIKIEVGGNVTTTIGSTVEVVCSTTGLPTASITWLFNGSVTREEDPRFVPSADKALLITRVTFKDVGYYICFANNSLGSDSKTSFLSVIGKIVLQLGSAVVRYNICNHCAPPFMGSIIAGNHLRSIITRGCHKRVALHFNACYEEFNTDTETQTHTKIGNCVVLRRAMPCRAVPCCVIVSCCSGLCRVALFCLM